MLYLDQHYLVSTSNRIPSNEVRLVRVSDENDHWAMSADQARRVGEALINAAAAMDIVAKSSAALPKSNAEIEAMLDAAHGEPFTDEQVARMLRKAKSPAPASEPGRGASKSG